MSIAAKRIDGIIKNGLHPALKREGFTKSSRTFQRTRVICIQIINVQASWTNLGDEGQFTINLDVYFPEIDKMYGLVPTPPRPRASNCMVYQRIGFLMPVQRDYWWSFDANSDLDKLAQDTVSACMDYGLPWLDEHSTFEGAIKATKSKNIKHIFSQLLEKQKSAKE